MYDCVTWTRSIVDLTVISMIAMDLEIESPSTTTAEVKFEQGVKDTSSKGATSFPGLAEKLGKLLTVSGLDVYWDFQVSGYMRRRDRIEDCERNSSASYSRTDSGAKGTMLFRFSIPVGPNPLLTVKGDMRFYADMTKTMENGGCAGIRKTKFGGSFSGGGQIKLCAGKKLFLWFLLPFGF